MRTEFMCEISRYSSNEVSCFLGYVNMESDGWVQTFRKNILPAFMVRYSETMLPTYHSTCNHETDHNTNSSGYRRVAGFIGEGNEFPCSVEGGEVSDQPTTASQRRLYCMKSVI